MCATGATLTEQVTRAKLGKTRESLDLDNNGVNFFLNDTDCAHCTALCEKLNVITIEHNELRGMSKVKKMYDIREKWVAPYAIQVIQTARAARDPQTTGSLQSA